MNPLGSPSCLCCGETPPPPCPECWTVEISNTPSCPDLQSAFKVPLVDELEWSCTIPDACTDCGELTISVLIDEIAETITVTAGNYIWVEDFTSCSTEIYEDMPNTVDGGDPNPTVTISASESPCTCGCEITCYRCAGDMLSPYLEVAISGMVNDECSGCATSNGTYLLKLIKCAEWEYSDATAFCPEDGGGDGSIHGLKIVVSLSSGGFWTLRVSSAYDTESSETCGWEMRWSEAIRADCVSVSKLLGPGDVNSNSCRNLGSNPLCDLSGVSVSINAVGTL